MIRNTVLVVLGTALLGGRFDSASAQKKLQVQPAPRTARIQIRPGAANRIAPQNFYLLRNIKVQDELKLDGDQKKQIKEAFDGLTKVQREEYGKIRGLPQDERRKKLPEVQKAVQAKIKEMHNSLRGLLKPEQFARLDQISLQSRGLYALYSADVVKKLMITADQTKKLQEVQKATNEKRRKIGADVRNGAIDRSKVMEKYRELNAEQQKKSLEVLTKNQRAEFEKMKGKPFDFGLRRATLRAVPLPAGKIQIRSIRAKAIPVKPTKPKADE